LRLHRLGHFADQIDHQQAVFQPGALDADEIGQFEATLETALRDAEVEELPGILSSALRPWISRFCCAVMSISDDLKPATARVMR
jgi:hypothetical protein